MDYYAGVVSATDNALAEVQRFGLDFLLKTVSPAPSDEAALAIIKGGALRQREMYFPYLEAKLSILARDWFPESLEAFIRYLYAKP